MPIELIDEEAFTGISAHVQRLRGRLLSLKSVR